MKNDNKADSTIKFTRKALIFLSKHTSLSEPEAVKAFIAQLDSKSGYKRNLCIAYNKSCKFYKIQWKMPLYRPEEREIIPPKKDKILMLMAEAVRKAEKARAVRRSSTADSESLPAKSINLNKYLLLFSASEELAKSASICLRSYEKCK